MTVIVGLVDNGDVWMGADSAGVGGYSLRVRKDPKVFQVGPFLIGFTSSFRMGQVLRYGDAGKYLNDATLIQQCDALDPYDAMVRYVVPHVRNMFRSAGYMHKQNDVEHGGFFLIGYRGRLFEIESDFQVAEHACEFDAVGCGHDIALGAMYASTGESPKMRVLTALEAAQEFSAGVRGPFTILKLEGEKAPAAT